MADVVANIGSVVGLIEAILIAQWLVRRWRPSVVVSVGGYASFAVALAAVSWRVPLVLVDFDAIPGASHRLLGRFAAARCTAFASSGGNVVVTGAPLRAAIESLDRSTSARREAKERLSPPIDPARSVVLVMTGSLGSHRVNAAVRDLARAWSSRDDRALVHVTGRRDYEEFATTKPFLDSLDYRVVDFGDMVELWSVCDVAVCRAGAITVAELTTLGVPSVLVPLPGAPNDHQSKNARVLADAGGAIVLSDAQCTGEALANALEIMMAASTLEEMSHAVHALAHPHAADAIAEVVLESRRP
jgi:UDP-N-acetylglucosamine:LPS N-acetylglucosamine transferase